MADPKPATPPTTFQKVWVDTPNTNPGSSFDTNCTLWRWVTGPESFLDNGVGLVWDVGLTGTADWDRNGTTQELSLVLKLYQQKLRLAKFLK